MLDQTGFITLTEATKVIPGRPSTNCVWRWCRKGVKARNGERVRLRHVRIGGKLYTKPRWIDEFGERLAEADAAYFDLDAEDAELVAATPPRRRPRTRNHEQQRREAIERAERELDEAGL